MKKPVVSTSALFNLMGTVTVAVISSVMVANVFAQSEPTGPTPPMFTPRIVVTPTVALVGVERTISVSGVWPNGCPPVGLTPIRDGAALTRALPLKLEVPLTLVACTQVITPYEFKTTFTPTRAGDYRLIAYTSDDLATNEMLMSVRSLDATQSLYNLTGMWYDLSTSGSGIVFVHNYLTSDAVFGAWFMYDQKGDARWYSAQEGSWRNDTEWSGVLYETAASPNGCAPPSVSVCPQAFKSLRRVGRARLTMKSRTDVKLEALATDGSVLFTSNLIKGI